MKILLLLVLFCSATCAGQPVMDCGAVEGIDLSDSSIPPGDSVHSSKTHVEIMLTKIYTPLLYSESVEISFDGKKWSARKWAGDLGLVSRKEAFPLRPLHSFDTIFSALRNSRLFLLPDQEKLSLNGLIDDGAVYHLFFKACNRKRSYSFNNPDWWLRENPEVAALQDYVNIVDILFNWLAPDK